jgi:hypothetical protein
MPNDSNPVVILLRIEMHQIPSCNQANNGMCFTNFSNIFVMTERTIFMPYDEYLDWDEYSYLKK